MERLVRRKHFLPVIILVLLLALGGISWGGWYLWRADKKSETAQKKLPAHEQIDTPEERTAFDPSEGGNYLVLAEWGVRFALPEDLKGDLYYGIDQDIQEGDAQAALFSSHKLVESASGGVCDLTPESDGKGVSGGTGAALIRSASRRAAENASHKQIGDMWYAIEGSNGGVCSQDSDGNAESAFNASLVAALKNLEAIPSPPNP